MTDPDSLNKCKSGGGGQNVTIMTSLFLRVDFERIKIITVLWVICEGRVITISSFILLLMTPPCLFPSICLAPLFRSNSGEIRQFCRNPSG